MSPRFCISQVEKLLSHFGREENITMHGAGHRKPSIFSDTPSIQHPFLVLWYPKGIGRHIELLERKAYLNLALCLVAALGPNIPHQR